MDQDDRAKIIRTMDQKNRDKIIWIAMNRVHNLAREVQELISIVTDLVTIPVPETIKKRKRDKQ